MRFFLFLTRDLTQSYRLNFKFGLPIFFEEAAEFFNPVISPLLKEVNEKI